MAASDICPGPLPDRAGGPNAKGEEMPFRRTDTDARADDTVRDQSQRLAALASAQAQIAAGGPSPQETMELIGAAACRLVAAGGAAILLPEGERLVCRAGIGTASQLPRVQAGSSSIAGHAHRIGQVAGVAGADLEAEPLAGPGGIAGAGIMLAIPLREGGTPTGVLVVAHGEPDGFDDGDLRLLELFSGMAASVLHRAQVEHSLAVTHAIAQAASVDATLESGLSGSLRVLTGRLGWDAAAIWLESDDHDGALTCRSHLIDSGLPAQQLEQSFAGVITPADPSPAWAAFAGGGSLWIDLTREPRPVTTAAGCGIATAVFVPLRSHGRPIGVLELLQRSPQAGGAAELGLLETLAAQIANFVARRLAEAQLVTQADNLAAVVALSQMIASVPVSHVRETMCVEIARLARVDVACLYEPDGKGGLLVTGQAGDAALPDGAVAATGTLAGQAFAAGSGRFIAAGELASHEADELIARIGFGWCHLQPVLRDGEVVAVLVLGARAPRMRPVAGLAELASLLAAETATTLALADLVRALDARARTDELTGLANRRTWDEELPREFARAKRSGRPLSVAILDLDHFKTYNDTFGHPAGDRLLRAVAAGWGTRLRETDLLARYGGEEFGLVLPDCDLDGAHHVLDELRLCMPDGSTCSIGVACWDGTESPESVVARADAALYDAKRAGRDRIASAA